MKELGMAIVVRHRPVGPTKEKYDATTERLEQGDVGGRRKGSTITSASARTGASTSARFGTRVSSSRLSRRSCFRRLRIRHRDVRRARRVRAARQLQALALQRPGGDTPAAMSQENMEIVRRGLDALDQRTSRAGSQPPAGSRALPVPDEPGCGRSTKAATGYGMDRQVVQRVGRIRGRARRRPRRWRPGGRRYARDGRVTRVGLEVEQDFSPWFRQRDGLIVEWRMHGQ